MRLHGAVTIITGASSGIGACTARAATARGARVVLVARRGDVLDRLAANLVGAMCVAADVTRPEGVARVLDATLAEFQRVDVLVNNAGQGLQLPIAQVALDDVRAVLELNTVAPLALMQAVIPSMRDQGAGAIVNVSSGTSLKASPGMGAYAASKAALNLLSRVARIELAADGIVVSTVYPVLTATDFQKHLRAGQVREPPGPVGPPHTPEQVSAAICDLIESGAAEHVLRRAVG